MALTANTVPSQLADYACPFDAMLALANAQTLAATGYMGSPNTIDLGGSAPVSAAGRTEGIWSTQVTNIDVSSNDESYKFYLFGSNDSAFGNGNVDNLGSYDLAAVTAGRLVTTIMGPSPTIPPTGRTGGILRIPFNNIRLGIIYRYVRGYAVISGTSPTITFSSWLTKGLVAI
jgi:hypothetical protein